MRSRVDHGPDLLRKTLDDISATGEHIQKLVEAESVTQLNHQPKSNRTRAKLAQSLAQMNIVAPVPLVAEEIVSCNTLPFPRNPTFYGRSELL